MPIMMTAFVQMAYNLVDMIWIGILGSGAVAAVGASGIYLWIADSFNTIAKTGGQIKVAHAIGEGETEKAKCFAAAAFQICAAIVIALAVSVLLFHRQMVAVFQFTDPVIRGDAIRYLLITGTIGMAFNCLNQVFTGMYTATGDSRTPFLATTLGLVLNLLFDPLLIFGLGPIPAMGVTGAAIATAGAQSVVTMAFLLFSLRQKGFFEHLPVFRCPDFSRLRQVFTLGLPVGIQNLFMSGLSLIVSGMVAGFGSDAVAVQKVGGQIESISWMVGGGFSMAVNTFVGQNYGAGKMQRVKDGYKAAMKLMVVWGVLCTAVLLLFPSFIFRIFIREAHVLPIGVSYLRILGYCQLFACIEGCAVGMFNGLGETRIPSATSVVCGLTRVPLAYFLSQTPLGLDGIWWGISITAILRGFLPVVFNLVYFKKRRLFVGLS